MASVLAARGAVFEVERGPVSDLVAPPLLRPYRPRARVLAPPVGDAALERIIALTGTGHDTGHSEVSLLDPPAAAERILAALAAWGYRSSEVNPGP